MSDVIHVLTVGGVRRGKDPGCVKEHGRLWWPAESRLGMKHIAEGRSQLPLLRNSIDDFVGPGYPVRFIDAFVDGLDSVGAGFRRVEPESTGSPGYDPADLLKLYIYGYLNRIRSSRRL